MVCIVNVGQRFGRLVVVGKAQNINGHRCSLCKCDCGNLKIIRNSGLLSKGWQSCGCLHKEACGELAEKRNVKHGHCRRSGRHPLYKIWAGIIQRCYNPKSPAYENYGGRGIDVCEEWHQPDKFYVWAINNGYQKGLTIERKNNDKGYGPDNCIFATRLEQANNKRNNKVITFDGQTKTVAQWSLYLNIPYKQLWYRLKRWPIEKALQKELS